MKNFTSFAVVIALVLAAAAVRLLPELPPNFSPVGAMGMFAGAALPFPLALLVSLGGLLLSDLYFDSYSLLAMAFVYAGLGANVLIGYMGLRKRVSLRRIGSAAFGGAVAFFILSNFGVWAEGMNYPRTFEGLLACYIAAIPFFWNTLASQVLFSAMLFSAGAKFSPREIRKAL